MLYAEQLSFIVHLPAPVRWFIPNRWFSCPNMVRDILVLPLRKRILYIQVPQQRSLLRSLTRLRCRRNK